MKINEITEFEETREDKINGIKDPKVRAVMACYWPIVTCIYLCVSFLTFAWHISWLIWPIAAAVFTCVIAFSKAKEEEKASKKSDKKIYGEE